jgi:hypothetical protein
MTPRVGPEAPAFSSNDHQPMIKAVVCHAIKQIGCVF